MDSQQNTSLNDRLALVPTANDIPDHDPQQYHHQYQAILHQEPSTSANVLDSDTVVSDLPPELLSKIAEGLELIDLFSFRHVCKAWNSAASLACAEAEMKSDPWFLMYGENSQCLLLTSGKRYINLPELKGTICLASFLGWLLIFQQGNMFFFSPFTRAKIDLPDFPLSSLSNHVAAFSSPPTSQDCTVLICRNDEGDIKLYMLRRGETGWTTSYYFCHLYDLKAAAYREGYFQFLDDTNNLMAVSPEEKMLDRFMLYPSLRSFVSLSDGSLWRRFDCFVLKQPYIFHEIGLELDGEYSNVDTCGTLTQSDVLYLNERVNTNSEGIPRVARGVWIQPRFHHMSTT